MDPTTAAAAPARTPAPSLSLEARRVALRLQALHAELDVIEPVVTRLAQTVRALSPLEPVLARLATLAASTAAAAAAAAPDPAPAPSAIVAPETPMPAATAPTTPETVSLPLFAPTTGPARMRSVQVDVSPPPPPLLSRALPDLHPPLVPARRSTRRSTTFPAADATAATTSASPEPCLAAATTTTKVTATPTSATTRRGRAPSTNESRPPARRSLPSRPAEGTPSVVTTTMTGTTTHRPRAPSVSMACRRPPPRAVEAIAPLTPGTNEPFFLDAATYFAGDPYAIAGTALQAAAALPSPPSSQRMGAGKKRARGEVVDAREASHTARGKRARRTATACMTASQPVTAVDEDDGFALLFGGTQP